MRILWVSSVSIAMALSAGCSEPATQTNRASAPKAVNAPRKPEAKAGQCAFSAWVFDKDPKGSNIRSGPGLEYPVIARLPRFTRAEGGLTGIDAAFFSVAEARNGWFRIVDIAAAESDKRSEPYPDGWIHGSKVDFNLQTDYAFAAPDATAARVASSWRGPDGIHALEYRNPDDCKGEWVHLLVKDHDRMERPAWVRGVCGNTETSCDGVAGDSPPDLEQLPSFSAKPD